MSRIPKDVGAVSAAVARENDEAAAKLDDMRYRSIRAHLTDAIGRIDHGMSALRADFFLIDTLVKSAALCGDVETTPDLIAAELRELLEIVYSIGTARRPEYEALIGKKCPLCSESITDVEPGRGSQVVVVCAAGHRSLRDITRIEE